VDDIRDIVVIAALIGSSLLLAALTLVLAYAGYKTLRIVRRIQRLNDEQAVTFIARAQEKLGGWNDREAGAGGGIAAAGLSALRWARRRRRRKKKRRFAMLDLLRR
jgi:hypothetical protein